MTAVLLFHTPATMGRGMGYMIQIRKIYFFYLSYCDAGPTPQKETIHHHTHGCKLLIRMGMCRVSFIYMWMTCGRWDGATSSVVTPCCVSNPNVINWESKTHPKKNKLQDQRQGPWEGSTLHTEDGLERMLFPEKWDKMK